MKGLTLRARGMKWAQWPGLSLPLLVGMCALAGAQTVAESSLTALEGEYRDSVRPMMTRYCLECHSTEKHKGDLDLEQFSSLALVFKQSKPWQQVVEQLSLAEMPPKQKPQPSPAEREHLLTWANSALDEMAKAHAGDPGPVVLRRLNNAEYTYTIRDLTGAESLDPAREFPADGAAGEGFMNTGNALVMSPALLDKYFEAGKEIATHAVLLPDGFRISAKKTRRDWTEEILADIRTFYRAFTDARGADKVNLQGIVFDTNEGGRLPLEKYLRATLEGRADWNQQEWEKFASERGLSAKYLVGLRQTLAGGQPSLLLDAIRGRWSKAKPEDALALAAEIAQWQRSLWKFSSVGHIGKLGGPKGWMEPVSPLIGKQEFRCKLPAATNGNAVVVYLLATDAGDGNDHDYVVWEHPRLVVPGRPDLLLRDAPNFIRDMTARRERVFSSTAKCLAAAAELESQPLEIAELAQRHGVEVEALQAWLTFLGTGGNASRKLDLFTNQLAKVGGYDFVQGWGSPETPSLVANASDQHVRIPGNLNAHSVAVHPSSTLKAAVGWRSPVAGAVAVKAKVTHAHPECGNGIQWWLELRRGQTRQRLAEGFAQGSKSVEIDPGKDVAVRVGDLLSLLIGPREANHSCDLTEIELRIDGQGSETNRWNLAADVSHSVHAGNPHADSSGREGIWHFYTEPVSGSDLGTAIPAGSLLAQWQSAAEPQDKARLALVLEHLLTSGPASARGTADTALYRQLASLAGPLFAGASGAGDGTQPLKQANPSEPDERSPAAGEGAWALDPALFGKHPNGSPVDAASLCVQAPSVLKVRLPSDLVEGAELVTRAVLHAPTGGEGSVQVQVTTAAPEGATGLLVGEAKESPRTGPWTSDNRQVIHSTPILVNEGSAARKKIEDSFNEFRRWFPAALCYEKIVPVDEVVTLTLLYREDEPLCRLMLDEGQKARLDRLWDELHYISRDALTLVDVFEQLWQYATQDADPKVFEPLRKPIYERAAAFRQRLIDTEPKQIAALLEFASRAYRRALTSTEAQELQALYQRLRAQEIPHEEAFQLTLARIFVAPAFLYRVEGAAPGATPGPVSDWELASRLSYFLWSSGPDDQLRAVAAAGHLHDPEVLTAQAHRLLGDARVRRLAKEFACAWLHIYDFTELNEKSERHFPSFASVREPMSEEAIRFFTDLFQTDGSVLSVFDADYTFLNETLARHYGIPGVAGAQWRRVDGVKKFGRGGVLGLGATLAKESGASRTSPILRGNWVAEVLLGDKLPRPPKDVPRLPEDEAAETLTVRQLVEKHSSDPRCATCHVRIDGYGFALEGFDAIGRLRTKDLGDRPIETRARVFDGTMVEGAESLREYLLTKKRDVIVGQFCRKLLGYALGRGVLLSDKPLLADMQQQLRTHDYRISVAIESIIQSQQFRQIRGKEQPTYD